MNKVIGAILLMFTLVLNIKAQITPEIWNQANEAYNTGQYEAALSDYQQLLANGVISSTLFYNLGNTYYRMGDLGHAVLNYERAILINPGHEESEQNLKLIFDQQEDPIISVEAFFLSRWWQNIYRFLSPGIWAVLSIVFMTLLAIGVWLMLFRNYSETYKWWNAGLLVTLFLSLLSIGCGYQHSKFIYKNPYAVVTQANVVLHDGADERSEAVKKLYPGAKVLIIDQISNWLKVSALDKEQGWIEESNIKRIALPKS